MKDTVPKEEKAPSRPNEIVRIRKGGRVFEVPRSQLVRQAMASAVSQRVMELVNGIHRNEMDRPVTLEHQWERVYADPSPDMRIIAAAQRGKTLLELVKTMAQVSLGLAVGWVMPKENKVTELVNGKLKATIENTPFYQELQANSPGSDSTRFKTFGKTGRLYIVTANSANELVSFSADAMHIDERDFCNKQNLPMYPARMNFSPYKFTDEISTPTVDGTETRVGQVGIDNIHSEFLAGDQHRYFSTCPHCGQDQILDWYENVVKVKQDESGRIIGFDVRDLDWSDGSARDIRVCCKSCQRPFDRLAPGEWRAMNPGSRIRSYWMEALNSAVGMSLSALLQDFTRALGNPSKMQTFHNMMLGRTYSGGSMRFTDAMFQACVENGHRMLQRSDGPCTIGIDVNRPWLDVQISKWADGKQIKVFAEKLQGGVDELIALCERFGVVGGVIDNQPEVKFSMQVQEAAKAKLGIPIVRCKYATNEQGRAVIISESGDDPENDPPRLITVNRTFAIDTVYESMATGTLVWFEEFRGAIEGALVSEMTNPVRMLTVSDAGIERFTWAGQPDHQLHAAVYDWLAGDQLEMNVVRDYSEIGPFISHLLHTHGPVGPAATSSSSGQFSDDVMIFRG